MTKLLSLLHNIHNRISGEAANLLISSSVFSLASLPLEEIALPDYDTNEVEILAQFYGDEATVGYDGGTFLSPPLLTRTKFLLRGTYSSEH